MIGIDTNVLVRFLVEDDPAQTDRVHRFLARSRKAGEAVYVSTIVLCEAAWVLGTLYDKRKGEILGAIEQLLTADAFQIEHEDSVRTALQLCWTSKAGFADCLAGELNLASGGRSTMTFDRSLRSSGGFTLL